MDLSKTMQMRRLRKQWNYSFKLQKEKTCSSRILYPMEIFFFNNGEIKIFSRYIKAEKKLITSRSTIQELLKQLLQVRKK